MTEQIEIQSNRQYPAIKLKFDRREDRWAHRWILATTKPEPVIMTSAEGTLDQVWPSSAPFQGVSRHRLEQGDAIFCVGMAGNSHWSASYSVECLGQEPVVFKSDLACLQKTIAEDAELGSTYTLDPNTRIRSAGDKRIEILIGEQTGVAIEALAGDDFQTTFELNDRTLLIRPTQISQSPVAATRWGFWVKGPYRVTAAPGCTF